jgi:hypothetical protein
VISIGTSILKKAILFAFLITYAGIINAQSSQYNWKALFYQSYYLGFKKQPPLRNYWFNLSTSNDVIDLQPLSYGLDAILAMYEATDSSTYLNDAILITNNVTDKAKVTSKISGNKSPYKDKYLGWIDRNPKEASAYMKEAVLSEIYFFQYVTRLLKDIRKNDSIYRIPEYKNFYFQCLNFIESNIWEKWENRGIKIKDKYAFMLLSRIHMTSHWAYIAAELAFLTANTSRRDDYLNFVNLYNNELEVNFKRYGRFLKWNSTLDYDKNGIQTKLIRIIQDVSHANLVVSYMVEALNLGLWTDTDAIQRLINTLKYKLWIADSCTFADNIDGTFFPKDFKGSIGAFQADGFVKLTRYDRDLLPLYQTFVGCNQYLIAWDQYGQLFANLALSEKLLKE